MGCGKSKHATATDYTAINKRSKVTEEGEDKNTLEGDKFGDQGKEDEKVKATEVEKVDGHGKQTGNGEIAAEEVKEKGVNTSKANKVEKALTDIEPEPQEKIESSNIEEKEIKTSVEEEKSN